MDQHQQLLKFISDCIKEGAKIDIRFRDLGESKGKAKVVMGIFNEITNAPVYEEKNQFRSRKDNIEIVHRFGKDSAIIII